MRRTASTSSSARRLALALSLAAAACGPQQYAAPEPRDAADAIDAMLTASAQSWTRGDLDGFLDDYAEDATFVGSTGLIRGRAEIRQRYVEGYWSSGTPEDGLRFRLLEVRTVGPGAAVAVGTYILFDRATGEENATGTFSLTLERRAEGWKIVHDHSS